MQKAKTAYGEQTVDFIKYLQRQRPKSRLLIIWDGASYHRQGKFQEYLAQINGENEENWLVHCHRESSLCSRRKSHLKYLVTGKKFFKRTIIRVFWHQIGAIIQIAQPLHRQLPIISSNHNLAIARFQDSIDHQRLKQAYSTLANNCSRFDPHNQEIPQSRIEKLQAQQLQWTPESFWYWNEREVTP